MAADLVVIYLNGAPAPKKTGGHRHHCPTCYDDAPCEQTCSIAIDLSDDEADRGSPVDCERCEAVEACG